MNAIVPEALLQSAKPIKITTRYLHPKYRFMTAAVDDKSIRSLESKYKKFVNHSDIYNAAVGAYMSIGRAFTSVELSVYSGGSKPFYTDPSITFLQDIVKPSNDFSTYISLEKKFVETKLEASKVLDFGLNFSKPEQLGQAEKIIKQYFPDFKVPTSFNAADLEGQGNLKRFSVGPRLESLLSVEQISKIIPNFTSLVKEKGVDDEKEYYRFKLPRGYKDANYSGIAYVRLIMELDRVFVKTSDDYMVQSGSSGSLLGGRYKLHVPVRAELVFRWPWDFAQYVTCAEGQSDFIPFLFYQYTNWHRIAYAAKRTRGGGLAIKPPARLSHLGNISQQIDREKKAGRIVKPRLNDDNFVIIGTGEPSDLGNIVWIDSKANRINEYMTQIRNSYTPDEKKIDLTKLKIKGTSLFYDAYNEKFVYIREAGSDKSASDVSGIQLIDLTGSLALDDITIAKRLNEKLTSRKDTCKEFATLCYNFVSGKYEGATVTKPLNVENMTAYGFSAFDAKSGPNIFNQVFTTIAESPEVNTTWASLGGARKLEYNAYGDNIISEDSPEGQKLLKLKQIRAFSRLLFDLCNDMLRDFDKITVAYSHKIELWRFLFVLITKYAKDDKRYQEVLQRAIEKNTVKQYTKEQVLNIEGRVNIASLPGIEYLMPHQVESAQDLAEQPPMTFIEAVVGGGKTAIGLIDLCNLLQKGEIKRPLVDVPGHLVRNWATEIRNFSKGKLNCFILTIQTVRRLQQVYRGNTNPASKPDYQFLRKIIESCPPNTVFLTNFKFAIIDREDIVYANSVITRYYSAEFLREMQFDLINIDESHGVKNIDSSQTKGASIVASVANFKREMSGTLVNNTLLDLVGQAAIANPSALGNKSAFISKYGSYSGDEDEDFDGEWRPDAASLIIEDMRPYTKRIIHKRNRIAFMLPEAIENFHSVDMTPLQKEFYDAMLERSFEALKYKNPKLFAKMIDANETDAGAITSGLSTHFQAIEEFLCAPDTVDDFLDMEGITDKDKVSPKVGKIVELLDQHFQGTLDNQGNYTEDPNQFKVIIFGNRRATSKHVFKHLPDRYRKVAVHYTADNKQAAEIFEHNSKIRIMVADGASITSGLNLQFAARMIRCETVWSPGDLEQAFARIWRPDFKTLTGGSERLKVYLDWLVCNESLDIAKIGRIISKWVEKMKIDRQEDPNFVYRIFQPSDAFNALKVGDNSMSDILPQVRIKQPIAKMFDSLPLIKMNHKTLQDLRSMGQLEQYFSNYALANDYELQEFNREKAEGLQQLIKIPDSCRTEIANSRALAFQSRVPGMNADVFDSDKYYGYKPISIIESTLALNEAMEIDEDDENYVEVNPVTGGELVDTEFGVGKISGILKDEVWVEIKGLGSVRVPKATAWLITNPVAIKQVTQNLARGTIIRNPPGIDGRTNNVYDLGISPTQIDTTDDAPTSGKKRLVTFKAQPPAPPPVATPIVEEEESAPRKRLVTFKTKAQPVKKPIYDRFDEDEDEDEDNSIKVVAEIIDGQIALVAKVTDKDSDMLVQDFDFSTINSYVPIEVRTAPALTELIDFLKKKFIFRDEYVDNFDMYPDLIRTRKLAVATPNTFRNTNLFFKTAQVKPLKENVIRPYPIVWGEKFFMAFDAIKTQSIRKVTQAVRLEAIAGVRVLPTESGVHVKFYKNAVQAQEDLGQIAKAVDVPTLKETSKFLDGIKKRTAKIKEDPQPVTQVTTKRGAPTTSAGKKLTVVKKTPPPSKLVTKPAAPITRKTVVFKK